MSNVNLPRIGWVILCLLALVGFVTVGYLILGGNILAPGSPPCTGG